MQGYIGAQLPKRHCISNLKSQISNLRSLIGYNLISHTLHQLLINGFADSFALGMHMQFIVNMLDMGANGVETDE